MCELHKATAATIATATACSCIHTYRCINAIKICVLGFVFSFPFFFFFFFKGIEFKKRGKWWASWCCLPLYIIFDLNQTWNGAGNPKMKKSNQNRKKTKEIWYNECPTSFLLVLMLISIYLEKYVWGIESSLPSGRYRLACHLFLPLHSLKKKKKKIHQDWLIFKFNPISDEDKRARTYPNNTQNKTENNIEDEGRPVQVFHWRRRWAAAEGRREG